MTLYAKYLAYGKHADPTAPQTHVIEVHTTQAGFFCESRDFGTSCVYDYSDARDAAHRFIRDHGYYLVHMKEVDLV